MNVNRFTLCLCSSLLADNSRNTEFITSALAPFVPLMDEREAKIVPLEASFGRPISCPWEKTFEKSHDWMCKYMSLCTPTANGLVRIRFTNARIWVLPLSRSMHGRSFDPCAWQIRDHNRYLLADVRFRPCLPLHGRDLATCTWIDAFFHMSEWQLHRNSSVFPISHVLSLSADRD